MAGKSYRHSGTTGYKESMIPDVNLKGFTGQSSKLLKQKHEKEKAQPNFFFKAELDQSAQKVMWCCYLFYQRPGADDSYWLF